MRRQFLTAILQCGLRDDFFYYVLFFFQFFFGLLFSFSLWTFIFLSLWTFIFPSLFGLFFIQSRSNFGFLPNFYFNELTRIRKLFVYTSLRNGHSVNLSSLTTNHNWAYLDCLQSELILLIRDMVVDLGIVSITTNPYILQQILNQWICCKCLAVLTWTQKNSASYIKEGC